MFSVLHGSQPLVKSPESATFLLLLQGAAWNSDLKGDAVMIRTGRYMHILPFFKHISNDAHGINS